MRLFVLIVCLGALISLRAQVEASGQNETWYVGWRRPNRRRARVCSQSSLIYDLDKRINWKLSLFAQIANSQPPGFQIKLSNVANRQQ